MMTPTREAYERYRLQWMLAHRKTLEDLIRELEIMQQENPEATLPQLFAEWEFGYGFGSEIWSSYREFMDEDCPEIPYEEWHNKTDIPLDETLELGSFDITSTKMTISDPCYSEDTWCKNDISNVLPGKWQAKGLKNDKDEWGQRVSTLIAVHQDYISIDNLVRMKAPFCIGVDSGQAGIFDSEHYRDSSVVPGYGEAKESEPSALWYKHCCAITLSDVGAGVLPYGVVSSSGYGDGCYDCYLCINNAGQVVRVEIEFITEDDEDE